MTNSLPFCHAYVAPNPRPCLLSAGAGLLKPFPSNFSTPRRNLFPSHLLPLLPAARKLCKECSFPRTGYSVEIRSLSQGDNLNDSGAVHPQGSARRSSPSKHSAVNRSFSTNAPVPTTAATNDGNDNTVDYQPRRGNNRQPSSTSAHGKTRGRRPRSRRPNDRVQHDMGDLHVQDIELPPSMENGFMGWREEDDEYWYRYRCAEKAFRGPHIDDLQPEHGPQQPLDRHGRPIEYPAASVYDPDLRNWRPTTQEEEDTLRTPLPEDMYFVPELPLGHRVTSPPTDDSQIADDGTIRLDNLPPVGLPESFIEVDSDDSDNSAPPAATLSLRMVTDGAGSDVRGVARAAHARGRRNLDMPPETWRVVNLGTSSAVPTRKRSLSSTAFLVRPAGNPPASDIKPQDNGIKRNQVSPNLEEPAMFIVDVGENTSARLVNAYWCNTHGFRWIRAIFITHLHGDHCYGLPSLLYNIGEYAYFRRRKAVENGNDGSDPVIRVFGPYGTRGLVRTSLYWTGPLGVRFSVSELVPRDSDFVHLKGYDYMNSRARDSFYGAEPDDMIDVVHESPPPHPEEVRADDIHADEDGLWRVWHDDDELGLEVVAAPLKHRVPCFGYVFREITRKQETERLGQPSSLEQSSARNPPPKLDIDVSKARSLGIHGRQFAVLRSGRSVKIKSSNIIVSPADVAVTDIGNTGLSMTDKSEDVSSLPEKVSRDAATLSMDTSPRKVVILGDTCDSGAIAEAAHGADLLLHEATFGNDHTEKAKIAMHSTAAMAGAFARRVGAKKLVLFHFSSRYESQWFIRDSETSESSTSAKDSGDGVVTDVPVSQIASDCFDMEEDDSILDDDMTNPNVLVREAASMYGGEESIVAAYDYMEHAVFRHWHGDEQWRARMLTKEQGAF